MREWSAFSRSMAPSDAAAELLNAARIVPLPVEPSQAPGAQRLVWFALAISIIVPWWLPVLSQPVATFNKEWLAVVAFAFSGLLAASRALQRGIDARLHRLILAALACIVVLALQAVMFEGA